MITGEGQIALWVGFFGMFLPFLYFAMSMSSKEDGKRKFHIYTMMVNGIASIAYLYMATGNGWSEVDGRQFFYARYIDWVFTTPLLLLDLCALGMVGADTTNYLIGMDVLMIVSGVIGAFLTGNTTDYDYHPWVFFAFGIFFFLPIVYQLGFGIPAKMTAPNAKDTYNMVAWLTIITWTLYPVVWVLAEGTHTLSPNYEVICYTVMDLLSKSVFGMILISSHAAMEEALSEESKPLV
jgi:bacteriorhodopsin